MRTIQFRPIGALQLVIVSMLLLAGAGSSFAQPGIDPPTLKPTIVNNPSPGLIFITPMGPQGGIEIIDDSGSSYFSISSQKPMINFQVQPGNKLSYFHPDSNGFVVLDSKLSYLATIRPIGPYPIDVHDLLILKNGHYLLMAYDTVHNYDLNGGVGTPKLVSAIGVVIQELDQDQNLVFQWRGFDEGRFVPSDMQHPESVVSNEMDATHSNSLDVDSVGNILLSSRNLSELTKIDRTTGNIIWRFGGKNNQFTIIGDSIRFNYQHSARFVAPDRIVLFDNGNDRQYSRAVEYRIDEATHTATKVWDFDHGRTVYGGAMGSVQRLPNGNTLIGWGATMFPQPAVTEVTPSGEIAYEAQLSMGYVSYRVFRFPWGESSAVARLLSPDIVVSHVTPNPAADNAAITLTTPKAVHVTMAVYNTTGELMARLCDQVLPIGESRFVANLEGWPHGTYRIVASSDAGSITRNLVH